MEKYDEVVELKFLNAQIDRLQKELLDMENVGLPEAEKLVSDVKISIGLKQKQLEEFRIKRIRVAAVMDEAKNGAKVVVKRDGAAGD